MKWYLHTVFKSPDASHECFKIEVVQHDGSDDEFGPVDYSVVPCFDDMSMARLYWGVRSLIFSKFPKTMEIDTFVNTPSLQIGDLCQDEAIGEHSNPKKEGACGCTQVK